MKKILWNVMAAGLVGVLLLTACQVAIPPASAPASQPTLPPTPIPLPQSDGPEAAPTVMAAQSADKAPSPTPAAVSDPAVKTVQDYFDALESKDYTAAANLLSVFSLTVDGMTRGDGADELHQQMQSGTTWTGLEVKDSRAFAENITLVHVTYRLTTAEAKTGKTAQTEKDELWPVRLENGQWLYNRNNLIDFRTLSIDYQTTAGLRVKPVQLSRYSDRIRMTMMVQNTTDETIVLGQVNEIMAAFSFKGKQIEAEKEQLIFERLHSYTAVPVEVKGLYSNYPDEVIIRQWKNLKVAPWFTFRFSE